MPVILTRIEANRPVAERVSAFDGSYRTWAGNGPSTTSGWTAQQRERAVQGYRIMASYVKRM